MTEQYRDGSDDDFFLPHHSTLQRKEFSFFLNPPFPIPILQYYCSLKKRKKEEKKDSF